MWNRCFPACSSRRKVYTVQTGDTLGALPKNDLTFRELCELNTDFKGAALTRCLQHPGR